MKKLLVHRLLVCLLVWSAVYLCASNTPVQAVVWEILPFPDSDWTGSHGQPATTNGDVVTLRGQPVRTVQTFSGALKISYDVVLQARTTSDGSLQLFFIPTTLPTNLSAPNIELLMQYDNSGSDSLAIASNNTTYVWNYTPFTLNAQTVYHCQVDVSAVGGLTWIIGTQTNAIPSVIHVPFSSYKLELAGWQPNDTWQITNFATVPEPSTAILVALGVGVLGMARHRRNARNLYRA